MTTHLKTKGYKPFLILLLCFVSTFPLLAQQHFYVGLQTDVGVGKGNFEMNKTVLKTPGLGPAFYTPKLHAAYRWKNFITLEAGVSQSIFSWKVQDLKFAEAQNDNYEATLQNTAGFISYFGNIQFTPRINKTNFLYFGLGYGNTTFKEGEANASEEFALTGEKLNLNAYYKNNSSKFIQPEIGIQWMSKDKHIASIGLTYYRPINNEFLTADYTSLSAFGDTVNTDFISANATYFGVNFKYNYLLHYIPKMERAPKEKKKDKQKEEAPLETLGQVADTIYTPIQLDEDEDEQTVNDREYTITNKITVHSKEIVIRVWDHHLVDGDRINLVLNGKWVLENHTLTANKYEIKVTLPEGKSDLILYALNLGKYSPNTSAVEIWDGTKNHSLILESNLEESGALEIRVKE